MGPPSLVGQTLDGRYVIEKRLGGGGMGDVYVATQTTLHRKVAIKVIRTDLGADAGALTRFRSEATTLARLDHPNTVRVHDFGVTPTGQPYLVMQLVDGVTLTSMEKPLAESRTLVICRQIAGALAEAHGLGIIHRDLKPDNVIVSRERDSDRARLIDFGISKTLGGGKGPTATGGMIGTPAYMSPEQVRGETLDERSDIYALGLVMYELACGRPPYDIDPVSPSAVYALMHWHVERAPPRPSGFHSGVSTGLDALILGCLEKDRQRRPQSMDDVVQWIDRLRVGHARGQEQAAAATAAPQHVAAQPVARSPVHRATVLEVETGDGGVEAKVAPRPRRHAPTVVDGPNAGDHRPAAPPSLPPAAVPRSRQRPRKWIGPVVALTLLGVGALAALIASSGLGDGGAQSTPVVVPPAPDVGPPVPAGPDEGWALIPAGTFTMGSPSDETGRSDDETQHQVTITRPFWMMEHEVTQGEWMARSGGANPSYFLGCGSTCPVELVDWFSVVAYANARSTAEGLTPCYTLPACADTVTEWGGGDTTCDAADWVTFSGPSCLGYRLPTESEWEYAARAGTTAAQYGDLDAIAWYTGNSGSMTHAAGGRQANAWGLYGMIGNVWEWTWDWFGTYPGTASDPLGASGSPSRVLRGGSWFDDAQYCRSASRHDRGPAHRNIYVGFRLSRSVPP